LSFARQTRTEPGEVQLNDLVHDVVRDAAKRAPASVTVEALCEPALPATWVSPSEMQQVLVNLVNNAVDALEGREGRVGVTTALDGADITIAVTDTGVGIPAGDLARIFDPFFTTKPVGSGTGLGLSICYGIVARLGGDIAVTTGPGAGSTFTVRIPRRAAGGPAQPAPPGAEAGLPDAAGERALRAPQKPVTVLIVDHEVAFVEALRRRLVRRQVDVLAARSQPEALSQLTDNPQIDVVLLDVQLPAADSLDTLRAIKAVRPLVEVLLVSSHTTFESAIEGMRLGAFDYLLKPCDMAPLLSQIRRAKARKDRQEHRVVEARIKGITLRRP
jgi:CheY-like chemotaxis protein/anti-sigma regulatory factor (Ser/Thr protein kinase)